MSMRMCKLLKIALGFLSCHLRVCSISSQSICGLSEIGLV